MPCYNCADTVGIALDSLLGQSLGEFEIVAVDDGSQDETPQILAEYARKDERVRWYGISHTGVVGAANKAIACSTGLYVARMDADDVAMPERLAAQAAFLDKNAHVGLVGCRVRFGGDRTQCAGYAHYVDWTNSLLDHAAISSNRFVEFPVPNPSIMVRRECIDAFGPYKEGDFPEDYELFLRWLEQGVIMAKVPQELLLWNDPPQRLSRTHEKYDTSAFYQVKALYLSRWLEQHNPHHPFVHVLGAGRTTRKRAEMLLAHGIRFVAYHDLDPRKIGHVVHGVPVLHRDAVPQPEEGFCLSYVASRGAREDIAQFLSERGFTLGQHWLPVA